MKVIWIRNGKEYSVPVGVDIEASVRLRKNILRDFAHASEDEIASVRLEND